LKQGSEGLPVVDIYRKAGISRATYFNWKKRYAGLLPKELRRLKQLEDENGKLKKLVADPSLDREMLQDVIRRMYGPPRPCKVFGRNDDDSCVNVSGLSRVGCCCSQAMMRSARAVST
jgi:putative transposase